MVVTVTRCCYDEDCMLRKVSHFQEVGPDDKPPIMVQRNGSSANVFFSVRTFSRRLSVFRIRNKKAFKKIKEPEATIKLTLPLLLTKQSFRITSRLINAYLMGCFIPFICLEQLCDCLCVQ